MSRHDITPRMPSAGEYDHAAVPKTSWVWKVPSFYEYIMEIDGCVPAGLGAETRGEYVPEKLGDVILGHDLERVQRTFEFLCALFFGNLVAVPTALVTFFLNHGFLTALVVYCSLFAPIFILCLFPETRRVGRDRSISRLAAIRHTTFNRFCRTAQVILQSLAIQKMWSFQRGLDLTPTVPGSINSQSTVVFAGDIGQTPEVRATKGAGTKITNFSLATSRPRLSEDRGVRDEDVYRIMDTEWHRII